MSARAPSSAFRGDDMSGWLDKASFVLLLLLASAVPLAFSPRFETFSTAKVLVIQFLAPAVVAARLGALAVLGSRPELSRLGLPFLGFLAACLLSTVTATNASAAWAGLAVWGGAFMVIESVAHHVRQRSRGRALMAAVVLSAGGTAGIGLLQYSGVIEFYSLYRHPVSTLGNVTLCAALYILAFPISLDSGCGPGRRGYRIAMLGSAFLMACHTAVMGSRAGWLGLLIGGLLVAAGRRGHLRLRLKRAAFTRVGGLVLLVAAVMVLASGTEVGRRLNFHWRMMRHQLKEAAAMRDPSSRQRLLLWQDTWEMAMDRLPLGAGVGNFEYVIPLYASVEARRIEARMETLTGTSRTWLEAHNEYLEVFAETGLLGLAAFGWLVVLISTAAASQLRSPGETEVDREPLPLAGVAAGVVVALLHAAFSTTLQNPASGVALWISAGVLSGASTRDRTAPRRRLPGWFTGAGAAALLMLSTAWTVAGARGAASIRAGRLAFEQNRMVESSELIETALGYRPPRRYAAYAILGQAQLALGRSYSAAHAFERAVREHPNMASAQHGLGLSMERIGQADEAAAALCRAAALDPLNGSYHVDCGRASKGAGRPAEALESYERALALMPESADIQNSVAVILVQQGAFDQAVAILRVLTETWPDSADYRINLSVALLNLGEADAAAEECRKLLAKDPQRLESVTAEIGRAHV